MSQNPNSQAAIEEMRSRRSVLAAQIARTDEEIGYHRKDLADAIEKRDRYAALMAGYDSLLTEFDGTST